VNEITSRGRRRVLEIREERRRSAAGRGAGDIGDQAVDRDVVIHALRLLPVGQRAVIVLRYYEDLPEGEVASVLGISVGTVKSQTARAMARLRHLMEES
jgi:RNA polymerase sigma factor (sigma-70 family)